MDNSCKPTFSDPSHNHLAQGKLRPVLSLAAEEEMAPPRFPAVLALLAVVLAAATCIVAYVAFDHQKQQDRKESEEALAAVASLKTTQINNWLDERRGDASVLSSQSYLVDLMKELQQAGALPEARKQWIRSRLEIVRRTYKYGALVLFDAEGKIYLSTDGSNEKRGHDLSSIQAAMRDKHALMSDLHVGDNARPELDIVTPLLVGEGEKSQVVGALLLRIDPGKFLFPLIQTWPTPSKTAETLLFRRDGDNILFLNELRHRPGIPLSFRLPTTAPRLLAVQAIKGKTGLVSGIDYRGKEVVGYIKQIPGTPWTMVTKIDQEEIYAPITALAKYVALVVAVLILAAGSMLVFWWRQRRAEQVARNFHVQMEKQLLEEQTERFSRATIDALSAHLCVLDEAGTVVAVNKAWRQFAHENHLVAPSDSLGANYLAICENAGGDSSQGAIEFAEGIRAVMQGDIPEYFQEYPCNSPDKQRWFVARVSRFEGEGPVRVVVVHENITERKLAEQGLRERDARILSLIDLSPVPYAINDDEGNITSLNQSFTKTFGYTLDDIPTLADWWPRAYPDVDYRQWVATAWAARLEKSIQTGIPFEPLELNIHCKDGAVRTVLGSASTPLASPGAEHLVILHDITERKRAEEALLRASERLALAQSAAGAGMWDWDVKMAKLAWSDELFRLFGLDSIKDGASFDTWHRVLHPNDRQQARERVEAAIREHKPLMQEYRIVLPSGAVRWIQALGDTTYDEHGEAKRMSGICIDITARKADEARIKLDREQEGALRTVVESILAGGTLEETLQRCLDQVLAVSWLSLLPKGGIFLKEKSGNYLRMVVSRNLPPEILSLCARVPFGYCLCGQAAARGVTEYAHCVDERHDISYPGMTDHAHYSVPFISSGRVVGVLVLYLPSGTSRNAEDEAFLTSVAGILATYLSRYEIEQELAHQYEHLEDQVVRRTAELSANEARTRAILRTMLDGLVQIDEEGLILLVNEAVESAFGYEEAELLGQNVSLLMPDPLRSEHDGYLHNYMQTHVGKIIGRRLEVTGKRKNGTTFPLDLAVNELMDNDGTTFIGVLRDITEQKAAWAAREEARAEAEAANRAKGVFLATMSHEIRTPINAILGMTHLAQKTDLTPKQRDYIEKTHQSGRHLLSIINDILDFSKIEDGKLQIESVDFNLDDLMKEVSTLTSESANIKGLPVNFDTDHVPHGLSGDPLRLGQVLINLISNAVKFTERGEITVRMRRVDEAARDVLVRFEVQDSGIGISDVAKSRLFQPFMQADDSTSRKYGGSGLGLAICKQLVELMGGQIGVESAPDLGSTFWFSVRLGKSEGKVVARPHEIPSISSTSLKGARILLAEDNLFNQQVATELLEEVGATVCVACNGLEVLDMLSREHFDVVLMDVQMPEMDGLEATRRLRADPALAGVPVIAMTANASNVEREHCFAAGMDDFIPKPVPPEQLYEVLARWLPRATPLDGMDSSMTMAASSASATLTGDPQVIDLAVLGHTVQNNPEKIRKFATRFWEFAEEGVAEIEAALGREDMAALATLGHRLKSSARTVGAIGFADLCQHLERFKSCGDIEQARVIIKQLRPLLKRIGLEIDRFLTKASG